MFLQQKARQPHHNRKFHPDGWNAGEGAFQRMRSTMQADSIGQQILQTRPLMTVSHAYEHGILICSPTVGLSDPHHFVRSCARWVCVLTLSLEFYRQSCSNCLGHASAQWLTLWHVVLTLYWQTPRALSSLADQLRTCCLFIWHDSL